jgi:hypothetical protein
MRAIRRGLVTIALYEVGVSVAVGAAIALAALAVLTITTRLTPASHVVKTLVVPLLVTAAFSALVSLGDQVLEGPYVLTQDAICVDCHTRQRVRHLSFLTARGERRPACARCGGALEPGVLWRHG